MATEGEIAPIATINYRMPFVSSIDWFRQHSGQHLADLDGAGI